MDKTQRLNFPLNFAPNTFAWPFQVLQNHEIWFDHLNICKTKAFLNHQAKERLAHWNGMGGNIHAWGFLYHPPSWMGVGGQLDPLSPAMDWAICPPSTLWLLYLLPLIHSLIRQGFGQGRGKCGWRRDHSSWTWLEEESQWLEVTSQWHPRSPKLYKA